MPNIESTSEQIVDAQRPHNLIKFGVAFVACAAFTAGINGTIEQQSQLEQSTLETPDFDPEEFIGNAAVSNVVGYHTEDIGLIDAGIRCYGTWNQEQYKFVASTVTSEWGSQYVDRHKPEAWTMETDKYDGLFHISVGNSDNEYSSWFWDNLSVEMDGTTATLEFYDTTDNDDMPEKVVIHDFEPGEVIGGSYNLTEYAMMYNDGIFTLALACNEEHTLGYMNRTHVRRLLDLDLPYQDVSNRERS